MKGENQIEKKMKKRILKKAQRNLENELMQNKR